MSGNGKRIVIGMALFLGAVGNGLSVNAEGYYIRDLSVAGPLTMTQTFAKNYSDTFSFKDSTGLGTHSWSQDYYSYTIKVTESEIQMGQTGVVLGETAYAELRNGAMGTFVDAGQSTATNLGKLDTALSKMGKESVVSGSTAAITVETGDPVTDENGVDKTTYTVKVNTGDIGDGKEMLVTGGTLYNEVHLSADGNYIQASKKTGENLKLLDTQIETNRVQIFEKNKEEIEKLTKLDTVTEAGKSILKGLVKDGAQVAAGNESITVTSVDDGAGNRTYTVSAQTGDIAKDSTKLVTGGAIYKEIYLAADGNYIRQTKTLAENLTTLDQQVKINAEAITVLDQKVGHQIESLAGDLNQVGASAAALAALRPEPFDRADKWSFAVGYGHYRNRNAAALGIYFKPTADTTVSLGGTVWSSDPLLNMSTSFKLGSRGKMPKASTDPEMRALAKRVKVLEVTESKKIDAFDAQSKRLGKMEAASTQQTDRIAHLEKDRKALQEGQRAQATVHDEKMKKIVQMQAEERMFLTETEMLQAEKIKMEEQMAIMLAGLTYPKGGAQ